MSNVIGMNNVTHPEYAGSGGTDVIVLASCPVPVPGKPRLNGTFRIAIVPGTLARKAYGRSAARESFTCNYELNPAYVPTLTTAGMRVSGTSDDGGARIVELPDHTFYLATGFLPQYNSTPERPHPLVIAFLRAAAGRKS